MPSAHPRKMPDLDSIGMYRDPAHYEKYQKILSGEEEILYQHMIHADTEAYGRGLRFSPVPHEYLDSYDCQVRMQVLFYAPVQKASANKLPATAPGTCPDKIVSRMRKHTTYISIRTTTCLQGWKQR